MNRRQAIRIAGMTTVAGVTGCAGLIAGVQKIEADLPSATVLYNSIKGVAQVVLKVAEASDPVIGVIAAAITLGDQALTSGVASTVTAAAAQLAVAVEGKWQASAPT
jgi:hypothetical protein